ncbi:2-dehydro-3-deoxygalactonokinase [Pseudovibrio sp. Tun.PSC04-5.I4]|uniref:2-dehydro-3-deoxygalactonokinase n=1 Tax=Pseudovibrio sp. Tun.PSC04-5.I4 TaxID=1798213 RepID=UPI000888747D|nr:2-dehydro-3-deoxygalactonokinase [Pseudovibrio sp. Tun.PSC04-5.I4]SDQ71938.1 2-dehydro-3-deoxygalactonokinase [Pseudovibrio sp. Tun.PSC04-5.I4]
MNQVVSTNNDLRQITSASSWIAVDWGTSSLRAWLIDENGTTQNHAKTTQGAGTLQPSEFEGVLLDLVGDWLPSNANPTQVYICGMAGSRQGWTEAEYVPVPTKLTELHTQLVAPKTTNARIQPFIVPGLCQKSAEHPDVMRGEETLLLGILDELSNKSGVFCLPGTHSKWVEMEEGTITRTSTFLSGELFALIAKQSILRHSLDTEAELDKDVFLSTLDQLKNQEATLLGNLFGLRAGQLLNGTSTQAGASRLSGLIIGTELLGMLAKCGNNPPKEVHLVGGSVLAETYALALQHLGIKPTLHDADKAALKGLSVVRKGAQNDNN